MSKNLTKTEKKIKETIYSFLDPKKYTVFIFGSRATNKAKKFSDYDIGIIGKKALPWHLLAEIEEAFEESDLPYKIEVVDFANVPRNFKKIALKKIKKL